MIACDCSAMLAPASRSTHMPWGATCALGCRVPEECPQGVVDLWRSSMAYDPGARPSAADVQVAVRELQPSPQPVSAEQSVIEELSASSGGRSAPQLCAPPQMQRRTLGVSGAVPEPPTTQALWMRACMGCRAR